ncbi:MAG TPA: hypothetical protein VFT99_24210 [Roseiflexaceae bacterium]|nr:hypothetical protein [Roseiflexaceae bacterium]
MRPPKRISFLVPAVCALLLLVMLWQASSAAEAVLNTRAFLPLVVAPSSNPSSPTPTDPVPTPGGADGALFLEPGQKIASPTILADAQGGLHAAYYYYVAAVNNPDAVYAYCPPPATQCLDAGNWQHVRVFGPVGEVQLQLTPAGQPRLLAASLTSGYAGRLLQTYQYAECDAGCLNAQNWHKADITTTQIGYIPDSRELTRRSFALDHAGRPRFVFYDFGSGDYPNERHGGFYYQCDAQCADASNWQGSRFTHVDPENESRSELVVSPVLKFTSANQPRVLGKFNGLDGFDTTMYIAYFACDNGCTSDANWNRVAIAPSGSGPRPAWDLELDHSDRPRAVVYHEDVSGDTATSQQLVFYACDANCLDAGAWQNLNFNPDVPHNVGQGADLALDSQGRPRIAHLVNNGALAFSWCDGACLQAPNWRHVVAEDTPALDADGNVIIPTSCVQGVWDNYGASLVLDANDDIRIAYNASYQAQCPNLPPEPGDPPTNSFQEVAHSVRVFFSPKP